MAKKIFLDPGHGGKDGGAAANGLVEKNLTLQIAKRCRDILLSEYEGADVRLSREDDRYLSLAERTNAANSWGADLLVSIHINAAANAAAEGFETFVYNTVDAGTLSFQNVLHKAIQARIKLEERGQKKKDLHMLRQSAMRACLTENGFISNAADARKMKDIVWLESCARGHAEGIASFAGLKKKAAAPAAQKPAARKLYRVQVGAFEERANAEALAADLKRQGYRPFIKED